MQSMSPWRRWCLLIVVISWRRVRGRWRGRGAGAEREATFVEHYMPRHDDAARGEVEAPIATMVPRVPKKNTCSGSWANLVQRHGDEVGKTETPKHVQLVVAGRDAKKQLMRR
jgi:hypothetical protein